MALKPDQNAVTLNTVYNAALSNWPPNQLQVTIESIGASVTVYGSQIKPTSAPTGMTTLLSAVTGITNLPVVPNYIYVTSGGSPTSVTLSGVDLVSPAV